MNGDYQASNTIYLNVFRNAELTDKNMKMLIEFLTKLKRPENVSKNSNTKYEETNPLICLKTKV